MAPPGVPPADSVSLETAVVLRMLAQRERRLLVAHLERRDDDVVDVDALVDHLAGELVPTRSDRQVALALHHIHLPVLDAHGLLEYAPAEGRVRYAGHPLARSVVALVGTEP